MQVYQNLDSFGPSLSALPEELVAELLRMVLAAGRLTPRLVKLFEASEHDSVCEWIRQNVQLDRAYISDATYSCKGAR
jgi:hypothetical protein